MWAWHKQQLFQSYSCGIRDHRFNRGHFFKCALFVLSFTLLSCLSSGRSLSCLEKICTHKKKVGYLPVLADHLKVQRVLGTETQ